MIARHGGNWLDQRNTGGPSRSHRAGRRIDHHDTADGGLQGHSQIPARRHGRRGIVDGQQRGRCHGSDGGTRTQDHQRQQGGKDQAPPHRRGRLSRSPVAGGFRLGRFGGGRRKDAALDRGLQVHHELAQRVEAFGHPGERGVLRPHPVIDLAQPPRLRFDGAIDGFAREVVAQRRLDDRVGILPAECREFINPLRQVGQDVDGPFGPLHGVISGS